MTREQGKVREFMQTFGQATPDKPVSPDFKTRALRVKLLLEEVLELAEASGVDVHLNLSEGQKKMAEEARNEGATFSPSILGGKIETFEVKQSADLVGVADALADIDYVMQGAAIAYGLDLEPFCDEVHDSNMTKLWKLEEVSGSPALNITRVQDKGDGRVCLVKNTDGKVMKSPSYKAADLKSILDKQVEKA